MGKVIKVCNYKQPYLIAILVIAILAICSVIFYRERMLFVDPVWITFNIINTKSFVFAEHRYGAFITQIFPLLGVYLGLSLKTILILYSFSFYLFYLSVASFIAFKLKQKWLTILIAIYLTVFVSDAYFWPNNEVHQGIAWMMLSIGLYRYLNKKSQPGIVGYFFVLLFGAIAVSSHLLVAVPFLFLWLFQLSGKKIIQEALDKRYIIGLMCLLVLIFARYKLSNSGWYDPGKLTGVNTFSLQSIVAAFQSGQSHTFAKLLLQNYWIAILLFSCSLSILISRKYLFQLGIYLLFILGYYVLICITFPNAYGRELLFYMESEWAGLSIILATPIVFYLQDIKTNIRWIAVVTCFVFAVRLGYIGNSFFLFHERYKTIETIINTMQEKGMYKLLIAEDKQVSEKIFLMDWGLPVESMVLSQINGNNTLHTFKIVTDSIPLINNSDSFYSCFSIEHKNKLNAQYFVLDTTENYHRIKHITTLIQEK